MFGMLTKTVESIAAYSEENIVRLKDIEGKIVAATQIDDVHGLKRRLDECLAAIRLESARQRAETERTVDAIHGEVERARDRAGNGTGEMATDVVTGLLARPTAEKVIAECIAQDKSAHVVALAVDSVQTYNLTFGFEVGDQVLQHLATFLRRQVQMGDQIFRWTGPALAILINRPSRIEAIRNEINAFMDRKFEHTVRTATRNIRLPITTRWTVLPMASHVRLISRRIDTFIAGANPPDSAAR